MRNDDSYSSLYAIHEDKFLKISKGEGCDDVKWYNMPSLDKNLLDNFMYVRNNMLLFAKSNTDMKTGKCTLVDKDTNRPKHIAYKWDA